MWAAQHHLTLLAPAIYDLVHGAIGESERSVHRWVADAKLHSPSLLLLDEFDVIFAGGGADEKQGESPATSLAAALIAALDELDRWNALSDAKVFVVATSRCPWLVPTRFFAPQRLGTVLGMRALPDELKTRWFRSVSEREEWAKHFSAQRVEWLEREAQRCAFMCDLVRLRRETRYFFDADESEIDKRFAAPLIRPADPHGEWRCSAVPSSSCFEES